MLSFFTGLTIFMIGSIAGWIIELFYRSIFENKKLVNPGFLSGPYLPVYGFGTVVLYMIATLEVSLYIRIICFAVVTTLLELITGIIFDKIYKIRLWDYSKRFLNYKGLICPRFSFYWTALATLFYFFVYPFVEQIANFMMLQGRGVFFIGFFYGVFTMDISNSFQIAATLRKTIINYKLPNINLENLKEHMLKHLKAIEKINFIDMHVFTLNNALKLDFINQIKKFSDKIKK